MRHTASTEFTISRMLNGAAVMIQSPASIERSDSTFFTMQLSTVHEAEMAAAQKDASSSPVTHGCCVSSCAAASMLASGCRMSPIMHVRNFFSESSSRLRSLMSLLRVQYASAEQRLWPRCNCEPRCNSEHRGLHAPADAIPLGGRDAAGRLDPDVAAVLAPEAAGERVRHRAAALRLALRLHRLPLRDGARAVIWVNGVHLVHPAWREQDSSRSERMPSVCRLENRAHPTRSLGCSYCSISSAPGLRYVYTVPSLTKNASPALMSSCTAVAS